jgi:acyl carrier protein phosphodiesterase
MNYLAHAYLSFNNPEILAGNLVSDFVKGRKKLDYPEGIQKGITLHRDIDNFTDTHETTRMAKVFFKPAYGLYSGALTDVVYDHFLANDPKEFFPEGADAGTEPDNGAWGAESGGAVRLAAFAERTYQQMEQQLKSLSVVFPERFVHMFPYMRSQNWLYNYRHKEGIYNSFAGLSRRALYMSGPEAAAAVFDAHYGELKACYDAFFPSLKNFAFSRFLELL